MKQKPIIVHGLQCLLLLFMTLLMPLGAWAESYGVYIGDIQVTDQNKDDIVGQGFLMYDPESSTLTINGYETTSSIISQIEALKIKVKATSSVGPIVWNGQTGTPTLTFVRDKADGDVELTVESADDSPAISGFSSYSYTNLEPAVSWGKGMPLGENQSTASKVIITPLAYPVWIGDYVQPTKLTAETWIKEMLYGDTEETVTASFDPKTFRLTLNNFNHDFSTNGLIAQIQNFGVNLVGCNSINVVEGEQPAMVVGSSSANTLTFYTSSTDAAELRLESRTATISGTGLTVNCTNGLIKSDGMYESNAACWTVIRTIITPQLFAYEGQSGERVIGFDCEGDDGFETRYSIDYVSDDLDDVTDALYAAGAESSPVLLGPCTVTAYTQYGDAKSVTVKAKLFGLADSSPSIIYGSRGTMAAPTLLPAIEEEDIIFASYYASPAADYSNIATIDGSTGEITIKSPGEVPFVVQFAKPENQPEDGCLILNNSFDESTLNFTLTVAAGYNLYVNGIQVTVANRINILGDDNESVCYDGGNTLILDNANLETIETALNGSEKLNIFLIGDNKIGSNDVANAIRDRNQGSGSLVIATACNSPGKLTLESSSNVVSSYREVEIKQPLALISPENGKLIGGTFGLKEAFIAPPLDLIIDNINSTPQTHSAAVDYGHLTGADAAVATRPLSNTVINNLLYTLYDTQTANVSDDGYHDGQVVLNSTMTDEEVAQINDLVVNGILVPGTDAYAGAFKGLTFLVPAGTGTITLTTNTSPGYEFHVKVGAQNPVKVVNKADNTNEVFEMAYASYNASYVYVYLVRSSSAAPALDSHRAGPKATISGGIGGMSIESNNIVTIPSVSSNYMMLDRAGVMASVFANASRGSHITLGKDDFGDVTDLAPGLFSPQSSNAPAMDLESAGQHRSPAALSYMPDGITYIDLRETSIVGMEVSRTDGAFKDVPDNTFIYMPAGNSIAKDTKNVVIAGICDNVQLNASVDAPFELADDVTAASATLSIDMTGGINSAAICLPYDLKNPGDYGKFYKLNRLYAGNTALNMTLEKGTVKANTPYIVDAKAGVKVADKLQLIQTNAILKKAATTGDGLVGVYDTQVGYGYQAGANRSESKFVSTTVLPFGACVPLGSGDNLNITWGGNVNGDNDITISDAVGIVNKILGTPAVGFDLDEADVNGDDDVTITDAVGVVNIILGSAASSPAPQQDALEVEPMVEPE